MYGVFKELTKENVLDKISSYDIFMKYSEGFEKLGKGFKSPLRDDDKNPSAYIIMYEGDLLFNDFGKGSYRAIDFVAEKYNLSFRDALKKINKDFNLGLGGSMSSITEIYKPHVKPIFYEKPTTVIKVKRRDWTEDDLDYWWNQYRISFHTLELFSVSPISHFQINDVVYKADVLAYNYDYYWEDEVFRRKIYQPYSEYKWFSNGGKVVQGEGMLSKHGDLLIITSSLKDVMTLYELGYTAIAPTCETSFVPEHYFMKQQKRFRKVILFMDSDDTGIKMNKRLSEKWGLFYITIPEQYNCKDISDFVKTYSKNNAKLLLNKLL